MPIPLFTVSHIVAMAENRVIGAAGSIPWRIPEDFKHFKAKTMGHAMIMGRKTFQSIGRPLPGRLSLVVTRQAEFVALGTPEAPVVIVRSIDAALAYARAHTVTWGFEAFVIGGGELYRETLPLVDRIYLTIVPQVVKGDTFYPELAADDFKVVDERQATGDVPCTFKTLVRKARCSPGISKA